MEIPFSWMSIMCNGYLVGQSNTWNGISTRTSKFHLVSIHQIPFPELHLRVSWASVALPSALKVNAKFQWTTTAATEANFNQTHYCAASNLVLSEKSLWKMNCSINWNKSKRNCPLVLLFWCYFNSKWECHNSLLLIYSLNKSNLHFFVIRNIELACGKCK